MLKYEWRPGHTIGDDDASLDIEDQNINNGIIPEPVLPDLPEAGSNPFVFQTEGHALPGATEDPQDLEEEQPIFLEPQNEK